MIKSLKMTLKNWRRRNHLVQKEAANNLGVSLRTYQGWEAGRGGKNPLVISELERRIEELDRSWLDTLKDALGDHVDGRKRASAVKLGKLSGQITNGLDLAARIEARRK